MRCDMFALVAGEDRKICAQRAMFDNRRAGFMFGKWGMTWHNRAVTYQQAMHFWSKYMVCWPVQPVIIGCMGM